MGNLLRKFAVYLTGLILSFGLIALAWSHIGFSTLGNRDTATDWLNDSGVYDRAIDALLDSVSREAIDEEDGRSDEPQVDLSDPKLRAAAKQAFSAEYLKNSAEEVVSGFYDFLDGKTAVPMFEIDVAEAKAKFAEELSAYAAERAVDLPRCSPAQLTGEFDPLSAECLPPGVTPAQAGEAAANEIVNNPDFLPDDKFSAQDIKVTDENGNQVAFGKSEQAQNLKRLYEASRRLPVVLAILSALMATAVVFLSQKRREGLNRVAKILILAAVSLGISWLLVDRGSVWLRDRLASQESKTSAATLELVGDIIKTAASDIARLLLIYTIAYALLAIVIFLVTTKLMKGSEPGSEDAQTEPRQESQKSAKEPLKKPDDKPGR